jgi:AcrR family transcriptional regulator
MTGETKARLSAQQWIEIGLQELSKRGPDALTIDALCRRTGKTKGSFYAHFGSHGAFIGSLVTRWLERNTEALLRAADIEPTPRGQLNKLNALAVRLDAKLDQGMRALAERHPAFTKAVSKVDSIRIANLARLHRAVRNCSEAEALDLATVEYAAYIGFQFMHPKRSVGELERLYLAFEKMTSNHATRADSDHSGS